MKPRKELNTILSNWVEDESIDEIFASYLDFAVEECETIVNFSELYAEKTVVVPATGILTEPARCREIIEILPTTSTGYPTYRFEPRNMEETQENGILECYTYQPYPVDDEVGAEHTVSFVQGGTTLTKVGATFLTSADVGSRLMIDESSELYEIISVDTTTAEVLPKISSATPVTSASVTVTPVGTRKYILKDKSNVIFSGSVLVRYQKKHPKLYSDSSMLLIPCPRSVALIALQQALTTDKYNVDAQRLDNAVVMAKTSELDNHAFKKTKVIRRDGLFAVRSRRGV